MRCLSLIVCSLILWMSSERAANALLPTVEEVSESIGRRLPANQTLLVPAEEALLHFAIAGEGEEQSLEIPWACTSYDHDRTRVFLEELAKFYSVREAELLRPRFSRILYTQRQEPFCQRCAQELLSSCFTAQLPRGQEGLVLFESLFYDASVKALPPSMRGYLLEALEREASHGEFPRSIKELEFMGGVLLTCAGHEQAHLRRFVNPEVVFKRSVFFLENDQATSRPLSLLTEFFLQTFLSKEHYQLLHRRQKTLMMEAQNKRFDQVMDLLERVLERMDQTPGSV